MQPTVGLEDGNCFAGCVGTGGVPAAYIPTNTYRIVDYLLIEGRVGGIVDPDFLPTLTPIPTDYLVRHCRCWRPGSATIVID